jgi:hypothetical protein
MLDKQVDREKTFKEITEILYIKQNVIKETIFLIHCGGRRLVWCSGIQ